MLYLLRRVMILFLCFIPLLTFAEFSCHLHPADNKQQSEDSPTLIGPFNNQQQCEKENDRLYQLKGRCHYRFDKLNKLFSSEMFNANEENRSLYREQSRSIRLKPFHLRSFNQVYRDRAP